MKCLLPSSLLILTSYLWSAAPTGDAAGPTRSVTKYVRPYTLIADR